MIRHLQQYKTVVILMSHYERIFWKFETVDHLKLEYNPKIIRTRIYTKWLFVFVDSSNVLLHIFSMTEVVIIWATFDTNSTNHYHTLSTNSWSIYNFICHIHIFCYYKYQKDSGENDTILMIAYLFRLVI